MVLLPFRRQSQLEEVLVLAKQFHETSEPISEWLSATDKKLANSEPLGTQTAKIQQQIVRHKVGKWLPSSLERGGRAAGTGSVAAKVPGQLFFTRVL